MYFQGSLTVDPSQLTNIEKIIPRKAFKRMFHFLTLGGITDQLEKETFTAISILQQINVVFINNGINNIVRLSHDDIDFYLDNEGKENDLKEAMDNYDLEIDHSMSSCFEKLVMILEYEDDVFKYLIEVDINRTHEVGAYPIEITISGFFKEFSSNNGDLKEKLNTTLRSQEDFESFKITKQASFESFMEKLKMDLVKYIKVDDVKLLIKNKIVVPKKTINSTNDIPFRREQGYHGLNYGYHGFSDVMLYTMMWSNVSHDHHIVVNDSYFEDAEGTDLGHKDSVDTSSDYFDSEISEDTKENIFDSSDSDFGDDENASNWFFESSDSDSITSGSSGSSCSSCSSCGGD